MSWDSKCVLSSLVGASNFTITNAKLYVPVVTSSIQDNAKLSKLLSKGFKRSLYWNKYKIIPNRIYDENDFIVRTMGVDFLKFDKGGDKILFLEREG